MMSRVMIVIAVLAGPAVLPSVAGAQSFAIGPRFSFVRGDLVTGTPSTGFAGGTIRMATSPHVMLEGSIDYWSYENAAGTERVREAPLQGSLLLFPVRGAFSPYVGGGIGLYSEIHDTLGATGLVTTSTTDKKIGWHLGAGAEIKFARHVGFFADYRFRFVRWGTATDGATPIVIPGTTVVPALNEVQLSHQGSMWTSGMEFYF